PLNPPAQNCFDDFRITNGCAIVAFHGGQFVTDDQGIPYYVAGTCSSGSVGWNFEVGAATSGTVTMTNAQQVYDQFLDVRTDQIIGGDVISQTKRFSFPHNQQMTFNFAGSYIFHVTAQIVWSDGTPVAAADTSWNISSMAVAQEVAPTVT